MVKGWLGPRGVEEEEDGEGARGIKNGKRVVGWGIVRVLGCWLIAPFWRERGRAAVQRCSKWYESLSLDLPLPDSGGSNYFCRSAVWLRALVDG